MYTIILSRYSIYLKMKPKREKKIDANHMKNINMYLTKKFGET